MKFYDRIECSRRRYWQPAQSRRTTDVIPLLRLIDPQVAVDHGKDGRITETGRAVDEDVDGQRRATGQPIRQGSGGQGIIGAGIVSAVAVEVFEQADTRRQFGRGQGEVFHTDLDDTADVKRAWIALQACGIDGGNRQVWFGAVGADGDMNGVIIHATPVVDHKQGDVPFLRGGEPVLRARPGDVDLVVAVQVPGVGDDVALGGASVELDSGLRIGNDILPCVSGWLFCATHSANGVNFSIGGLPTFERTMVVYVAPTGTVLGVKNRDGIIRLQANIPIPRATKGVQSGVVIDVCRFAA